MKIGVVGSLGVVGSAIVFGMQKLGNEVIGYDIRKEGSSLDQLFDCEVIFLAVPSPSLPNGECDTSIVEKVVDDICKVIPHHVLYPIIVIKSTVTPGFTQTLIDKYGKHRICFSPEFLRERCSISDLTENQDLLIIGTKNTEVFEIVKKANGKFPKTVVQLTPTEAEMAKYFNNVFNATRVVFANSMFEVCKKNNINYTNVKNAIVNIKYIPDYYLDVNENSLRGFGGMCLPKDTVALAKFAENTNVEFFKDLLKENNKYKTTVFPGMREK